MNERDYIARLRRVLNLPIQKHIEDGRTKGWEYVDHIHVVCGFEIGFRVPHVSSIMEAEKCKEALVSACGREIELLDYKGLLVVRVIEKDWPDKLRFKVRDLCMDKLLIGYDRLMRPVYHPLNVHILQGGASGSGKTDLQRFIAYQAIMQGYDVYICDMKGYSFDPFRGLVTIADSLKACVRVLEAMVGELERRKKMIQSGKYGSRSQTVKRFRPILIMIDEAADLAPVEYRPRTDERELAERADLAISYIGRKGREPRVFCIYCTQRPDAKIINRQFKSNVEASIAGRTKTHFDSQIIIDRPGAELISPDRPGRVIYSHGKDQLLQVPYVGGDEEWEQLLKPLHEKLKGAVKHDHVHNGTDKKRARTRIVGEGADCNDGANLKDVRPKREPDQKGEQEVVRTSGGQDGGMGLVPAVQDLEDNQAGGGMAADDTDSI